MISESTDPIRFQVRVPVEVLYRLSLMPKFRVLEELVAEEMARTPITLETFTEVETMETVYRGLAYGETRIVNLLQAVARDEFDNYLKLIGRA